METEVKTFRKFLETAFDQGDYATDDLIAFVMPLLKEVLTFHETSLVGPFEKEETLFINNLRLDIDETFAHPAKNNISSILALFGKQTSKQFDIVESIKLDTDIDSGVQSVKKLNVHLDKNESLKNPAFVPGYVSYEQLLGHHDEQTDIFCLGLVIGSMALSLDLYDPEDLKLFAEHRNSPVRYNNRIHPTVSALITEMTELDRGKRSQDLYDIIHRLENYRDYDPESQTDLSNLKGWVNKDLTDKSQLILNKLKNRLFDKSRRNRLLYYKPNMRFMNLTVSSVPLVLHYQSIRPELLFTWNDEISGKVKGMKEIILNKYLRFEDHRYISSTLDKIRVESQRDVHEYGFSQLKLVITFLNWHNLREDQHERIQSPLLLIPVELKKNKKLKEDHYVLKILDNEAEVNPVISNYLNELYGIKLPDYVDLDEMSLEKFYVLLKEQVDGANQGITLNYLDKPRVRLIHSVAKQTLSNYKKRLKRSGNALESYKNIAYSYQQELYKPLGLEIFRQRVEPRSTFLEFLVNEDIKMTEHQLTDGVSTKERQLFNLAEGSDNPYSWDFDLCNIVLGNFNYKKMSLVRDYNNLIDEKLNHSVFENLFSNLPREHKTDSIDLSKLDNWNHVITADPTQTKAILKSRTGESYIIQGPPGTGKSQTITNLVADFVAQGKSVLFVCEKRAALDVVYHRLKKQGLDELCCYIHDSQGDKREFIRNLKVTYEDFIANKLDLKNIKQRRTDLLKKMYQQLEVIRHFHDTNSTFHAFAGTDLRKLLEKVVELKENIVSLEKQDLEILPNYAEWIKGENTVRQLNEALASMGLDGPFAEHPFSKLQETIFSDENPARTLEALISKSKTNLIKIIDALKESGGQERAETFEQLRSFFEAAQLLLPLSDSNVLYAIDENNHNTQQFDLLVARFNQAQEAVSAETVKNAHWIKRFTPADTINALALVDKHEKLFFSFLNGSWRSLKKQLHAHYDFSNHVVKPSYRSILFQLKTEHDVTEAVSKITLEFRDRFAVNDIGNTYTILKRIRPKKNDPEFAFFLKQNDAKALIQRFASLKNAFNELESQLSKCFYEFDSSSVPEIQDTLESISMNMEAMDELLPALLDFKELPAALKQTLRRLTMTQRQTEATIAGRTLDLIFKQQKKFRDTNMVVIKDAVRFIQWGYNQLLALNADVIRAEIRQRFLSHIELSTMAISQLNAGQRQFKKEYNEGRKILENEFGKSMRYKSIRELSGKESGLVLKDLKPVWLMSPLSVSDSLPLNTKYFDAIIFDEASQITLEEGIPSLYRASQTIIVGDEKQMPPSNFFTSKTEDPDDLDSKDATEDEILSDDADSLLVQGARKLSSVMLGWHYRSRFETLISYSNHAFYGGDLLTIPDKTVHHTVKAAVEVNRPEDAVKNSPFLFDRSISYHFLPKGVYEKRMNQDEANYIANLVRELLKNNTTESIGIVAFSQEQQHTIEDALVAITAVDKEFEQQLEEAYTRTEEDQFIGLFVKNLENVQGDERDIIIMSVCYGFDSRKRMIMNFGPINKKGGEKRLNVIFSRAKKHMAIVSSIKHHNITNEYNEGANYLKQFLHYAELVSEGSIETARTILKSLVVNKKEKEGFHQSHVTVSQIKAALQKEGYEVDTYVGQSDFKCSIAVKAKAGDGEYTLGVMIDDDLHYKNENLLEQYYQRPSVLENFGWKIIYVFTKDWLDSPKKVIKAILKKITDDEQEPLPMMEDIGVEEAKEEAKEEKNTEILVVLGEYTFERFVFTDATSNKFWEVAVDDTKLVVRFGRIDTKGQTQIKSFASLEIAMKEKEKMVREKLGKGYKKVSI